MEIVKEVVDYILGLGATVMLPIIICIFGLIMGQGFTKSFRAGLVIGIGFVGIGLVISLLFDSLGPATKEFVSRTGVKLDILDVGWPIGAAISFGTPVAAILIPVILLVNIIMLFLNQTETMDIDLWNYWHFIFAGSVAYYTYNSMWLGILVGVITAIITFKLADWTAPTVYYHFGLKGVSLPHAETVNWAPITYLLNKIEDKIPVINKISFDEASLKKRFGIFGEPIFTGLLFGIIMGILAGYDVKKVLTLGIQMASILFILPKMVAILMEGLIPLSEGIREFIYARFPNKKVHIGLDAAVVIGQPTNMSVALFMVPVTILLALVLPYNRMLPFADLAVLPFTVIWAVAASRGNIFRGILNSIIVIAIVLFIATNLAEAATTIGKSVDFDFPEDTNLISGIDLGSHLVPWILIKILDIKNISNVIIGCIFLVVYFLIWRWVRDDIRKQYQKEIAEDQ